MRSTFNLNGIWDLAGFDEDSGDWQNVVEPYPIPAEVPGEVHPSLFKAGIIEDPYYGMNPERVNWVAEKQWWYRRVVRIPDDFLKSRTFLEFDGLDTFATVFLDGEIIGTSSDMFIPQRFDVTDKIKEAHEHVLEVRFAPAQKICSLMDLHSYIGQFNMIRIGARKMQCSFGWDWTPELIGAGIWRNARVVSYDKLSIHSVRIRPELDNDKAIAHVSVEVVNHTDEPVFAIFRASLEGFIGENVIEETIPAGGGIVDFDLVIDNPKLWWPNGMGEQPLYKAIVTMESRGAKLDSHEQRFGIRTIELRETDDKGDPAFIFVINGVPVFAKGANWIPADHFPSQVSYERYRELITLARDAHYNMLRVWGGGIYENPAFYDLCDEMGIMIWQDFMYTLAEYPETPDNLENAEREVNEVVRDLRNHPSVVLWCGNNECEMSLSPDAKWPGKTIFHDIIPRIVEELDGTRPFWPSSPYGGPMANSPDYGDSHGGAWFGTAVGDVRLWRELILAEESKFVSEFYAQGPPEIESIRRFIPQEQILPFVSPVWELHNPDNEERHKLIGASQQESLVRFTEEMMGQPKSAEEFAYLAGILQGEFLKAEIEQHRIRKFRTAGSLFWMINDTWPSVSYSVVDYYLRPKPAYYYMKRALAPVILVFAPAHGGDEVCAWVVNDLLEEINGVVEIATVSFNKRDSDFERISVTIPANGVRMIWTGKPAVKPSHKCLAGSLFINDEAISRTSYFSAIFRELVFPQSQLKIHKQYFGDSLNLEISSDTYAHAIKIANLPDTARADDNYFDLFPGETRTVTISGISAHDAETVTAINF